MRHAIFPNLAGLSCILLLSTYFTGCNSAAVPEFVLGEEPGSTQGVVEVREALLGPSEEDHADHDDAEHAEHDDDEHAEHDGHENISTAGPIDVVVVGQVGGLPNPWEKTEPDFPFVQGEAKFFLADAGEVAAHQTEGHQHTDGEECSFCAAHAEDSSALLAIVQFNDKDGKIVKQDARQLFDLNGSETVVVRGKARIVEGGLLVVDADGVYVRR